MDAEGITVLTDPETVGGTGGGCGESSGNGQVVVAADDGRIVTQNLHL